MKNFKQVIAPLTLAICVAGVSVYVNAAWSDPTCDNGASSCNKPIVVNKSVENQVKTGEYFSTGYINMVTNQAINHTGFIASLTNVEAGSDVTVGAVKDMANIDSTNDYMYGAADFRVVKGFSWFKDTVNIGASDLTATNTPTTNYTLQLQGTTNLGIGDYCTIPAYQLTNTGTSACPGSGTFGPSLMTYYNPAATSTQVAVRCGKIAPTSSSNPANLGSCYTTPPPSPSAPSYTHTGTNDVCDTEDNYHLTTNVTDGVPQVTLQWQSRESTVGSSTSWANISSPDIVIEKHGYVPFSPNTPRSFQYRVIATDSINQTTTSNPTTINSVNRPTSGPNGACLI